MSSRAELASSLSSLKISPPSNTSSKKPKQKSKPVADSWEDESLSSSGEDTETEPTTATSTSRAHSSSIASTTSNSTPAPPPPTPASPSHPNLSFPTLSEAPLRNGLGTSAGGVSGGAPERRPDKTTSAAARMIAAGIGAKLPRRTEEEREYDKAMREKERKRRDKEREERKKEDDDKEKAKQSVWYD